MSRSKNKEGKKVDSVPFRAQARDRNAPRVTCSSSNPWDIWLSAYQISSLVIFGNSF